MITIVLNGEKKRIEAGLNVDRLLKLYHINPAAVVVERNEKVLAKNQFESTEVEDGDLLEIVNFVGGGA